MRQRALYRDLRIALALALKLFVLRTNDRPSFDRISVVKSSTIPGRIEFENAAPEVPCLTPGEGASYDDREVLPCIFRSLLEFT